MTRPDRPPGHGRNTGDGRETYQQQYRRCGKTTCTRCAPGQPGHGPYWYAFWWEDGRRRSRYIGKTLPREIQLSPPAPAENALRVQTLGGFAVHRGDTLLTWTSRRAEGLFKCLLGAPGHRLSREQAGELLWPATDPDLAAANLRTAVHRLRRTLDLPHAPSHIRTEGESLALEPAPFVPTVDWLDAGVFERLALQALAGQNLAACRRALEHYGGDYLLDDLYGPWTEPVRGRLSRLRTDLQLHLARLAAAQSELEEAEVVLRQVLAIDPGQEEAAAALMGLLAGSGRGSEAMRVYQALAQALEEDLDVAPGAEVETLRARIVAQRAPERPFRVRATPPATAKTNLPTTPDSFVGRDWELAEICDLVAGSRLVTLTGPGGCGKTRLALEAASILVEEMPDGAWLVELGGLGDASLVPSVVANVLGVEEEPGNPLVETLCAAWRDSALVVLLDNCEHLLGACAGLVAALLAGCPRLRVLATSRERLAIAGEVAYRVPSLATPDPARPPPPETLAGYEAVALFVDRARAQSPGFALTAANAGAVTQICSRLDGLPLAIELAAARMNVLSAEGIAQRLDDRFRLLAGGPRTALPRQQTLRATMDWSYSLLAPAEQTLLRRLAVFAGGWTLEAAEAVCADDELPAREILDRLDGLVQKSLVTREDARYRMLETVRDYVRGLLEESGELHCLQERHARHHLDLAEAARNTWAGSEEIAWLARLEGEHDNLRAALRWARETGETELGLRLAAALGNLWVAHGNLSEGSGWLEALLAPARPGVTNGADAPVRANALRAAGNLAAHRGDLKRSMALHEEALTLYRRLGDQEGIGAELNNLGYAFWVQADYESAVELYEESLALARELGEKRHIGVILTNLADVATAQEEYGRAAALYEEALALWRSLGSVSAAGKALQGLGEVRFHQGEYGSATTLLRESLILYREASYEMYAAASLEILARVACALDNAHRAARLFGAAAAMRERVGAPRASSKLAVHDSAVAQARGELGEDAFDAAWAEGKAMDFEHAIACALEAGLNGSGIVALVRETGIQME